MSTQLSIGNELKGSYKDTYKWVQTNLKWLGDIGQFYKERAKLEHEYSEKLSCLTREYFNKKSSVAMSLSVGDNPAMTPGSTEAASVVTWNEVLTQTEEISKEHWRLSRDFEGQVSSQLTKIYSNMERTLLEIGNFNDEMANRREEAYRQVEKSKKNYDEACALMENARNKNTKSPSDRNRQKMEERRSEMNIAKNEYLIRINQGNRIKDKFYFQDSPEVLDLLQELNECRVFFLNDIWKTASSVENTALERISKRLTAADDVVKEDKPSLGTAMFIKHNATNWTEPKDFLFEPSPIWQDDESFVTSADPEVSDLRIRLAQAEQDYDKYQEMTQAEITSLSSLNDKRHEIISQEVDLKGEEFYSIVTAYLENLIPFTVHETLKLKAEVQIESIQNNVPADFNLNTDDIDLSKIKKKSGLFGKLRNKTHLIGSGTSHSQSHLTSSHLMPIKSSPLKLFGSAGSSTGDSSGGSSRSSGRLMPVTRATRSISNASSTLLSRKSSAASVDNDDNYSTRSPNSSHTTNGNRVLFAFQGHDEDEVSMNPGDSISILAPDTGSGWTKLRNNTTRDEGLAPTSYLEIKDHGVNSNSNEESDPSLSQQKSLSSEKASKSLTVLYDYDAQEMNEMTVKAGDVITVCKDDDGSGWTLAEFDGDSGLVPTSYCK